MNALIAGATGAIGKELLIFLLNENDYSRVTALVRRPLSVGSPKLNCIDFSTELGGVDDVFICLGTTIKKAGSKEAFREVDFDLTLKVAQEALAKGAKRLFLVSSLGANPKSPFFYLKVKGEVEAAVSKLGYEQVHIFRPTLLDAHRDERRMGEELSLFVTRKLKPILWGPLKSLRPIKVREVAEKMCEVAKSKALCSHVTIHEF